MSKVKIIPCSGIGKVYGLMAREAAFGVTEQIPELAETVCLAHLVTGEAEADAKVKDCPCITIDGCPALCSAKSVEASGGSIVSKYRAVDEMRRHRGENAGTGTALTEAGWAITDELASRIMLQVKEMVGEEEHHG